MVAEFSYCHTLHFSPIIFSCHFIAKRAKYVTTIIIMIISGIIITIMRLVWSYHMVQFESAVPDMTGIKAIGVGQSPCCWTFLQCAFSNGLVLTHGAV